MGAIVALLITADLLLARVVHYSGVAETILSIPVALAIVAIAALPLVVICWEWRRKWFRTSLDLLSTAAWVLAVWILIGPLVQIAARSPAPLVDATLGPDRPSDDPDGDGGPLAAGLSEDGRGLSSRLRLAMAAGDNSTFPAHPVRSCPRRAPLPSGHQHFGTANSWLVRPLASHRSVDDRGLRAGQMQAQIGALPVGPEDARGPRSGRNYEGIVAFPSFHTILAILSTRALWGIGKLRVFSAALCVAICISTVATGWHYVIDVFAGIAVATVAQMVASWALRTQPLAAHSVCCSGILHSRQGGLL